MKTIGILAEQNARIFDWETTRSLLEASGASVIYFVEIPKNKIRKKLATIPARLVWRAVSFLEGLKFGAMQTYAPPAEAVALNCRFEGYKKVFLDGELAKLMDVDLVIRLGGRGIYAGNILSAPEAGLLSIHHGDNRVFRGGPPGFWEIVIGAPKVGYVVQQLTPVLDGGRVLARGERPCERFAAENRKNLFQDADRDLARVVSIFLSSGKLPEPELEEADLGPIYRYPGLIDLARYLRESWLSGKRSNSPANRGRGDRA